MAEEISAQEKESRDRSLRPVIFVLGALNLASWAMYATSNWFGDGVKDITLYMWSQFLMLVVVQFLVTLPALALAWRNERLTLAFWLVAIPWIFWLGNVLAFAISVAIYGF